MKKICFLLILIILVITCSAQSDKYNYKFRLWLKDKGKTAYTLNQPQEFLSEKAIERRLRQAIAIDSTDLPLSEAYLNAIEESGCIVVAKSKWLKTVCIHCEDSITVEKILKLPFVDNAELVWQGEPQEHKENNDYFFPLELINEKDSILADYYGYAWDNIKLFEGESLHNAGFRGQGIDIAIIDGGFSNLPNIELLNNIKIKGYKDFVYNRNNLFNISSQHGLNVLSCIATNMPQVYVGTAPEASFWLLGSEDERSEFPIEEDYWATAIEYADSVGVDVVNTSLGYTDFDLPTYNHSNNDLDGKTTLISRAASIASEKGMLLVCSAGNSGNKLWQKISPPADADGVLTVGAITRDSTIASFSSRGLTSDLRIKPDVVALGSRAAVIRNNGKISYLNGTSFASPITAGIAACLWQAFSSLTNGDIIAIMHEASNNYNNPNEDYGYGIPNMPKAVQIAEKKIKQKGKNVIAYSDNFRIESDRIGEFRIIYLGDSELNSFEIQVSKKHKKANKVILQTSFTKKIAQYSLKSNKKEVYTIAICGEDIKEIFKIYL